MAFLVGSKQLAGMGFERARIHEALILADNDTADAADYLSK